MLKKITQVGEFTSFLYDKDNYYKIVLVKFSTTWCSPCQELQKNIEKLLTIRSDLSVLEVDAEKFPELAQKPEFDIRAVPTIFLFWQGKMVKVNNQPARASGYLNLSQLQEFINIAGPLVK